MFVFLGLGISQIQKLIHRFTGFKARRNHENIWYDFLYFKAIQLQPIRPVLSPVALLHLPEKHPAPDIPRYGNVNTSEVGDSPPYLILKLTLTKKCASFLIHFCLAPYLAISFAPCFTLQLRSITWQATFFKLWSWFFFSRHLDRRLMYQKYL